MKISDKRIDEKNGKSELITLEELAKKIRIRLKYLKLKFQKILKKI